MILPLALTLTLTSSQLSSRSSRFEDDVYNAMPKRSKRKGDFRFRSHSL